VEADRDRELIKATQKEERATTSRQLVKKTIVVHETPTARCIYCGQ